MTSWCAHVSLLATHVKSERGKTCVKPCLKLVCNYSLCDLILPHKMNRERFNDLSFLVFYRTKTSKTSRLSRKIEGKPNVMLANF